MQPCKHGHHDGAMHIPCYQCRAEHLEAENQRLQAQFQRETLRTSDLSVLLLEWINRHEAEHEPGVWSRSCGVCALVKRSRDLLALPINGTPNVKVIGSASTDLQEGDKA